MFHPLTSIRDFLCLIFLPHKKQQLAYDEAFSNGQLSKNEKMYPDILFDPHPYPTTPSQSHQDEQETPPEIQAQLEHWQRKRVTQSLVNRNIDAAIMQEINTTILPAPSLPPHAMYRQDISQHKTLFDMPTLTPSQAFVVEDESWLNSTPVTPEEVPVIDKDATVSVPAIMRLKHAG